MRSSLLRAIAAVPAAALLCAGAAGAAVSVSWQSLDSLVNDPPRRAMHTAIYDALRDRMLVYGGAAGPRDVWTMSLGQPTIWSILPTQGTGPSTRQLAVCAIDTHRDRLIVFGGLSGRTDVWALPLSEPRVWQRILPAGPVVASTDNTVGVYDPFADRLVVFDAADSSGAEPGLLWQLSLTGTPAWSPIAVASTQPARRRGAQAIYDPGRRTMVLFQGYNGDFPSSGTVWALDLAGSSGWSQLADATTTGQREHYSAALDLARDRVLIFGGELFTGTYFGDTEAFGLGTHQWTHLGLTTTGRGYHAAIFDPLRDRMIVHGGDFDPASVQALGFTPFMSWKTLGPPVPGDRPQPRAGHAVIRDPVRDCLWMTGGGTWRFDLAAPHWYPVASPDLSRGTGVIRDAARDRLIATDGNRFGTSVWQFDPATETWSTLQPIGAPTRGRHSAGYAYDPLRDRLLMFGGDAPGTSQNTSLNDLWSLTFSPQLQWVELFPGGTPPLPRYAGAMVYDPVRDRLLLHGGIGGPQGPGVSSNELWELPLSGGSQWHLLAQVDAPAPRHGHTLLYDAARDQLLMLGGYKNLWAPGEGYEEDAWALPLGGGDLTWEPLPQSAVRPLPRVSAAGAIDPLRDQLVWFGGNYQGDVLDDTWRMTMDVVVSAAGPAVGRSAAFELRLAGAAPVEGPVEFEVRLPDDSPGQLEVFDVAGRRLASRTLLADGAGRAHVRLARDELPATGLCFARLRHRAEERRLRFVRLR